MPNADQIARWEQEVLTHLANHPSSSETDIAEATQLPLTEVNLLLGRLQRAGKIRTSNPGRM